MESTKVEKTITVNATPEKVWQVLLNDEYTRQWFAEFSPGTYAISDWKLGSEVIYQDGNGMGMAAKITAIEPYTYFAVEFTGVIKDGVADYDSDDAKKFTDGSGERYRIVPVSDGVTRLDVSTNSPDEYLEMMTQMWDKALEKFKRLAEA
ncbi:hypothetical protein GCM10023149_26110 [Mucilaginibacter gynuensis]|uniref:Activator of Hsp90 ATPase homologue 1/2-like C-terminal domain-containing protein n=1 Tax=Mucilaginibacter gynuensis TaxID=1302236 RepID=A0ABP8GI18_9SPHI